ncbi:hypothetical protein ACWFRM_01435 [Streptomyces sp. NPDC055144]
MTKARVPSWGPGLPHGRPTGPPDRQPAAYSLTASDDAVTVTTLPPATSCGNATLPKLYRVAPDGKGGAQRVSCNPGDQVYAAADTGRRVL